MLLSGLENPSRGSIIFQNKDLSKISEEQKLRYEKKNWSNIPTILSDTKLHSA